MRYFIGKHADLISIILACIFLPAYAIFSEVAQVSGPALFILTVGMMWAWAIGLLFVWRCLKHYEHKDLD